jgi:DNA-binding transcriptional LysR family regulator
MNAIDIRKLDFQLLLIFRALLRTRRTTAAARELHLSQSAISHALARLRQLFGDELFVRRGNGLAPTAAAERLGAGILEVLELASRRLADAGTFTPRSTPRRYRIAANDFVASLLMPPLADRLATEAPAARIAVRFAVGREALEALRERAVDVAVGRFGDLPEGIDYQPLDREAYRVIARRGHPQLGRAPTLRTYLSLEHILVSFRGDVSGTVDQALARDGHARSVRVTVPMFLTAFGLVARSDLVATVPARLVGGWAAGFGLESYPLPVAVAPFEVGLATLAADRPLQEIAWLRQIVGDAWMATARAAPHTRRRAEPHARGAAHVARGARTR